MNEFLEFMNKPVLHQAINFIGLFSLVFALVYSFTTAWLIMFILPGSFFFYGVKENVNKIIKCFKPALMLATISFITYTIGIFYKINVNFEVGYTLGNNLLKAIEEIFPKIYLPLAFFWAIQVLWGVFLKNKPKDS